MNMTQSGKPPTYEESLKQILASSTGPFSIDALVHELLSRRPSNAKNPLQAAIAKIHEQAGRLLVFVDKDHVLPLRLAFEGARYRLRLTREQADRAALPLWICFETYLPRGFDWKNILLIDSNDDPIPYKVIEVPHEITFHADQNVEYKEPVVVLKEWFHSERMYFKDHILVTIVNWEKGVIRLERERFGDQHADQISESNRTMADQLYALLESARYEDILYSIAVPTAYARLPDKQAVIPDHWSIIVNDDPRMTTDDLSIRYRDDTGFAYFEDPFMEKAAQHQTSIYPQISKEEGRKVYRFRAELAVSKSIWREVAILGRQSLTDLDSILRDVFNHDSSDHLSGFWKMVVRSGSSRKRYREVDLGDVNPFEPTEEEATPIAVLKLNVGDRLKYVYDFGDWIEHTLELKSIDERVAGAKYPREIARNEPNYQYCMDCAKKGKQTIAYFICFTCSNELQEEVLLCEDCLAEHEDHYVDDIIY